MNQKRIKVVRRQATLDDVDAIFQLDQEVWTEFPGTREMFASRIETFPEGNFVSVVENKVVGYLCEQFINFDLDHPKPFTWLEITDNGMLKKSHNPKGNYVYGVSMMVSNKFQGFGIGTQLILCGWGLMISNNKWGTFIGSRIPDFQKSGMSIDKYISQVREDSLSIDSELRLYQKDGCKTIMVLPNYISDPESGNYGVLVYRYNPFHNWPFKKMIAYALRNIGPKFIRSSF